MAVQRDTIVHPAEIIQENELETAILERLYNSEVLRQSKASIRVSAVGGVATLTGNVRTDTHRDLAKAIARRTPGVSEVRSDIVVDTTIENEVAMALALDPRTRLTTDQVGVKSLLGSVLLSGKVGSVEQRDAALEIARGVNGVWEAVNGLVVSEALARKVAPVDMAAIAVADETPGVAEAAQAQGFVPEWPRKTAKGKEAPPLSSS